MTRKKFNYRLCRARRFVGCAFGILSNKWGIFHSPLDVTKPLAKSIIKACVVLHNLVRGMDGAHNEDLLENGGFMTLPPFAGGPGRNLRSAEAIINAFANYFVSPEGALPWHNNKILALGINFYTEGCKYWPTNIWVYGPCKIFSNIININL